MGPQQLRFAIMVYLYLFVFLRILTNTTYYYERRYRRKKRNKKRLISRGKKPRNQMRDSSLVGF